MLRRVRHSRQQNWGLLFFFNCKAKKTIVWSLCSGKVRGKAKHGCVSQDRHRNCLRVIDSPCLRRVICSFSSASSLLPHYYTSRQLLPPPSTTKPNSLLRFPSPQSLRHQFAVFLRYFSTYSLLVFGSVASLHK